MLNTHKRKKWTDKPGSVGDSHSSGHTSPHASSDLPEPNAGRIIGFLFGLAPSGVCPAMDVTTHAVRSYRTISPLPRQKLPWRYIFCGTFRKFTFPRNYLALCPMEPGLSSHVKNVRDCLVHFKQQHTEHRPWLASLC